MGSNYKNTLTDTPLSGVNYKFGEYLKNRKDMLKKHMGGNGLPDYAYYMDYEYRKKLDSMPGAYKLAKTYSATIVPAMIQQYSLSGVTVGPNQFPEIYNMVCDCAKILGIGIPTVIVAPALVVGDMSDDFNACTYATDDIEPVIILTGLMVERMSPGELKAIIAHECGHIHNNHSLYSMLGDVVINGGMGALSTIPGISQFIGVATMGVEMALNMWSRAAEVSSDRAALICTGNVEDTRTALGKLMYRGADITETVKDGVNIEALREQMERSLDSVYRLNELAATHPIAMKRVFATLDFAECEKYYEWRPDLKKPDKKLLSKSATDEKVKKYISVVNTKGAKKSK